MKLAIVIPTRSRQDLFALSASPPCRTYVVYDAQGERPSFAGCQVLQGPRKGFGQACNVGLSQAQLDGYSWVLVLNDDAQLHVDAIRKLVSLCEAVPCIVGPVVYHHNDIQSAGIHVYRYGRVALSTVLPDKPAELDALAGVSMLIPSWSRFDKRFIHGFEDIALCFNMRRLGYKVLLAPDARCEHKGGGTIPHQSRNWFAHSIYGQLLFYNKKILLWPIVSLAFLQAMKTRRIASFVGIMEGARRWLHQERYPAS